MTGQALRAHQRAAHSARGETTVVDHVNILIAAVSRIARHPGVSAGGCSRSVRKAAHDQGVDQEDDRADKNHGNAAGNKDQEQRGGAEKQPGAQADHRAAPRARFPEADSQTHHESDDQAPDTRGEDRLELYLPRIYTAMRRLAA